MWIGSAPRPRSHPRRFQEAGRQRDLFGIHGDTRHDDLSVAANDVEWNGENALSTEDEPSKVIHPMNQVFLSGRAFWMTKLTLKQARGKCLVLY